MRSVVSEEKKDKKEDNRSPMQKSVSSLLWALGLAVYILWSFTSNAWHITWIVFPILAAADSLLTEVIRQKETLGTISLPDLSEVSSRKTLGKCIWIAGLLVYLLFSILTGAWGATWLLLPITGAVKGLVNAILDYKEAVNNET